MNKLHLLLLTMALTYALHLNAADAAPAYDTHVARPASPNTVTTFFNAIKDDDLKKVTEFIEVKKIDVNIKYGYNFIPLHMATAYSKLSIAEFLLNHGADINALNRDNETPLHMVAKYFNLPKQPFDSTEPTMVLILQLLLNYGADLTIQNKTNIEPLFYIYPTTTISEQKVDKLLIAARNIDAHKESDEDTILLPDRRERMKPKIFLPDVVI